MSEWNEYIKAYEIAEMFVSIPPEQWPDIAEGFRKWAAQAPQEEADRMADLLRKAAEIITERS